MVWPTTAACDAAADGRVASIWGRLISNRPTEAVHDRRRRYLYRHGKRVREISIHEKVDCPADRSEFVWIGICDPTHEEMRILSEQYGLHPLAVETLVDARQLPKIDVYGDHCSS